ncbi:response regulator [Candidatus Pacearchaeota archaeon]|nr:response regulator [Candidatus Pacearchaeota archaeon]
MNRALIGMHDVHLREYFAKHFRDKGYEVETTGNFSEMRKLAETNTHRVYFMDINLGLPNVGTCAPAEEIYGVVRSRVEKNDAFFFSFSANDVAVRLAQSKRIPASDKNNMKEILDFLRKT